MPSPRPAGPQPAVQRPRRPALATPPSLQAVAWLTLKAQQAKAALQASPSAAFRWAGRRVALHACSCAAPATASFAGARAR